MENFESHTLKVSGKGQVVIPSSFREALGISAGSTVEVRRERNGVFIALKASRPHSRIEDGFGMLKYAGPPRKLADFDVATHMRADKSTKSSRSK